MAKNQPRMKAGKGEGDVKDIGKGEGDVKDIGKGEGDVKDIGKGGLTPAAVGSLFASLGSVNGWLVVSFVAPVQAATSGFGSRQTVDFQALRTVTKDRDGADAKTAKTLSDLKADVTTLKAQGSLIALSQAYPGIKAKRPKK
jgi:hypothetical protein